MGYYERAARKLEALREKEAPLILAFESSCDETACAVLRGREVLADVIASQIEIHRRFGGVVPEIASRNHTLAIDNVAAEALERAGVALKDVDCVAVTYGAGLLGALLVGVSYAKALAYAADLPLLAVNHIRGHIAANYVAKPDLKPPFLCLIVSGGHTALAAVEDFGSVRILGSTRDDACGEAFDKVARVLGLPYPGGPQVEKAAVGGRPLVELPTPFKGVDTYDFSFSGIKTAVINYVHRLEQRGEPLCVADLACSFQEKVTDILVSQTMRYARDTGMKTVVVAGGVGANARLRNKISAAAHAIGARVFYPPLRLCTDNAVMIASEAYNMIRLGARPAPLDLDADADLRIV